MAMMYKAYLSGLDMLVAIAIMLPFVFMLAYAAFNGYNSINTHSEGMLGAILFNTKLQEVLGLEWRNVSTLSSMLADSLGPGYTLAKAPPCPCGTIPSSVLRLIVVNGDVYYIEGEFNESTGIN
ncbi:MAG: hypothetical protein ACP5MZ_04480 [Candidatus Micrarchaeia archaeon]